MNKKSSHITDEEKIIERSKAILGAEEYKENELLKEFSDLHKQYKKLFKQHRFLLKRSDKQELEMRRMNDELVQTNELLKGALEKGTMQIRESLIAQVMNLAGELVLTRNQLIEASRENDSSDRNTENYLQNLDRVTSSLQERIMQTRMQPIGNVLATLPKIITAESQKLKKLIRLEIEASEADLDKTILDSLAEPLAHIIRNACKHGIETPAQRYESGKSETGLITVQAFKKSGQVNILIQDDGKGFDKDAIKLKALKEGFMTRKALNQMNEKEVLSLLMRPGFSKSMDEIKSAVEKQGGSVEIFSEKGKGASIGLKLPLTLSIIPCLIVVIRDKKYAIPKANVDELVRLYDEEIYTRIKTAGSREVCLLRNKLTPIVRMKDVLERPEPFTEAVCSEITEKYAGMAQALSEVGEPIRQSLLFVIVKNGLKRFGLVIDQVAGSEEIVVNPMHPKLNHLGIYSGTTIMGDGTIALILDVRGIASHTGTVSVSDAESEKRVKSSSEETDSQRILIFEIGAKERFALPLPLIRRVQEISRNRIEKVGDKSYITVDDISTYILRMDLLLDVSLLIDKDEMYLILPRHTSRPFGVLISGLVDVVPAPMALDQESHKVEGVLGTAIILERMTLFPDIYHLLEKADPEHNIGRGSDISDTSDTVRRKILLVEDTVFFRGLVKGYLESGDYKVSTAENGLKALELMDKSDFDLIVSDIEMPEMNGWDFLEEARRRYRYIPAIALTALDSPEHREMAKKTGFDAYERKIDRDRLLTGVAQLLKKL